MNQYQEFYPQVTNSYCKTHMRMTAIEYEL